MRAVYQLEVEDARVEDVAAALGLDRSTVFGWQATYRAGGWEALRAREVPGRPAKLDGDQRSRLQEMITDTEPRQWGFAPALWTRELVRQLIWQEFAVQLSVASVGRVLHQLGLTPQRPLHRALQRDPEAVQRWKDEDYPALRDEARQVGATVYFADEAGLRSDYHAGTTWAPSGQTPVVETTGKRFAVNMISAVTPAGALRFSVFTGSLTPGVFIDFCQRLAHDSPGPAFVIVDGHPTHRSHVVADYVASTRGQVRLTVLPGYAPDLNPDEWVWKNVKTDHAGRASITSNHQLEAIARSALHRLQKLPHLVRSFFADPQLAYITTP